MSNAVFFLKSSMPDADDMVKEYLDIIKHEIDNSRWIIADLLDFARTKMSQVSPVVISELVTQVLGKCVISENINVRTDIPDALPEVEADLFQMGQVLRNLIVNAIQAMPEGGVLRITARQASNNSSIEISISDTGEGISPENMDKLFRPLFTTKSKGIGLGLTICKNLVEVNGGEIEVKSEMGAGSTFTVRIPIAGSE